MPDGRKLNGGIVPVLVRPRGGGCADYTIEPILGPFAVIWRS